jgi:LPS-assembly lipoprotein
MSLSRARFLRAALVVTTSLMLSACFKPMYGGPEGAALQSDLQAIAIDPISERAGHYLGNELRFLLNGTGSEVAPRYRLQIVLRERIQASLVDSVTQRATAGAIVIDADYKLIPIGGGAPITSGVAFTFASYDRSSQRFANIRAARDAEIRDAKVLADQIKTRIAMALAKA